MSKSKSWFRRALGAIYYSSMARIKRYKNSAQNAYWVLWSIRLFNMPKRPQLANGEVYVHLGCGRVDHEKFINVDGMPFKNVHYVNGLDRLPMFKDRSVDLIYASHCLEHFKYFQIVNVLREWRRTLKPGGVLRLSVPDFDLLVKIYQDTGNPNDMVEQLMGGQNNKFNYHLAVFNRLNLTKMLQEAGFDQVRLWQPGANDLSSFNDFSIYTKTLNGKVYPVSLNIEAVRE